MKKGTPEQLQLLARGESGRKRDLQKGGGGKERKGRKWRKVERRTRRKGRSSFAPICRVLLIQGNLRARRSNSELETEGHQMVVFDYLRKRPSEKARRGEGKGRRQDGVGCRRGGDISTTTSRDWKPILRKTGERRPQIFFLPKLDEQRLLQTFCPIFPSRGRRRTGEKGGKRG